MYNHDIYYLEEPGIFRDLFLNFFFILENQEFHRILSVLNEILKFLIHFFSKNIVSLIIFS